MKSKPFFVVSVALALSLLLASSASALFLPSDGQAATLVLGQPDFTSSGFAVTQSGMYDPGDIAVDPTTGKIFVSDSVNNRVLRFNNVAALSNGAAAEAVLGQSDFVSSSVSPTGPNTLWNPRGVAVDANGTLWVGDAYNNRVLRFDHAASTANGANADGVLGQPGFSTRDYTASQSGMWNPYYLTVDTSGRLWVADSSNRRVLRFDNAASKPNGAEADGVLGQPDFTSNASHISQNGFGNPGGLVVDGSGRLWVADLVRVLRFDNAASKPNGANADGVLGQPDFTSSVPNTTQSGMFGPDDVTIDIYGTLYVSEFNNSRVLVFGAAASLPNGANADFVLGQPDFVTQSQNTGGISAATLSLPSGVFFDPAAKVLWVADAQNGRVLMYGQPYATLHILPFIGLVRLFLPPGVTPIGSISIQTADGALHTFDVSPDVRILPSKRVGQLSAGSFVTLLTRFDQSTGNMVVFQIVVHPQAVGPGAAP